MKKTGFVLMLALPLLLVVGLNSLCQATPIQWEIEDGGNGHYYEAVLAPNGISWHDAKTAAESAGGYLATVTSQAENDFVFYLIDADPFWLYVAPSSNCGPWLGGFQPEGSPEPDGDWQWVTSEPFNYTNWDRDVPDNQSYGGYTEQDYLSFGWESWRTSKWNDLWDNNPQFLPRGYVIETPEPATILLLGLSALVLPIRRRG